MNRLTLIPRPFSHWEKGEHPRPLGDPLKGAGGRGEGECRLNHLCQRRVGCAAFRKALAHQHGGARDLSARQQFARQSCLAHPRFAADQQHMTFTPRGLLPELLRFSHFVLAGHKAAAGDARHQR